MKQIYPPFEEIQLLHYLLGKAGEEERTRIEKWLLESEENREYMDRLEKVWVEAGRISPVPVAVDVDAAWNKMLARIGTEEPEVPVRSLRYVWTVAAILLVSLGLYFMAKMFLVPPKQLQMTATTNVLRDTLPDGSRIALNRNSTLGYPEKFRGKKREVRLSGEAFFEVTPDREKPFVVEAGDARVKVLGTSFNVKAFENEAVEVSVEEGMVMLFTVDPATQDTLSVMLSAGMRGRLPENSMQPEILEEAVPDRLFWLDGTLEFRQTGLQEVVRVLSEQFGVVIRADRPEILNCRLSATFRNESLETILEVISASFGLEVRKEGNGWVFYGKGC